MQQEQLAPQAQQEQPDQQVTLALQDLLVLRVQRVQPERQVLPEPQVRLVRQDPLERACKISLC